MILLLLILLPLVGGLLACLLGRRKPLWARTTALLVLGIELLCTLWLWGQHAPQGLFDQQHAWFVEGNWRWIPQFGIGFHVAMDGLSLLLVLLTCVLGLLAVVASWTEIQESVGFFHGNILWVLAGVIGVFLAVDLLLFYVFWEIMLVPMYFLIGIWGHEKRQAAAIKFFIFTQASGLLMFAAILALVYLHFQHTGVMTFDFLVLLGTPMTKDTAMLLMLGFFIAFAVKLPMMPLHLWLPDAHTQAPTAGSVILAGVLLKTGGYGLLRFVLPLFPEAARSFAPVAMGLGVLGILYGAILALAQTDLKRLVAYTSISHLGFVLVGIFAWNQLAFQGAVLQMLCHGLSTGALFMLVGALQERLHSRDIRQMGGLWAAMPRLGGVAMVLAMASLGLPGLGNFVAEFLVLLGAFQRSVVVAIGATLGLIIAALYALRLMQQTFHGMLASTVPLADLSWRTMTVLAGIIVMLVWIGLYPQPILNTATPALTTLQPAGQAAIKESPSSGLSTQSCFHRRQL